jgi:ribosomal protein S18 acetylase RimI-like enzyme
MLAVDPTAVRGGVGTALVLACQDRARAAGGRRLVCSVEEKNVAALRIYERLGYRREPDRDWSPASGFWLLVLGLDLDGASS